MPNTVISGTRIEANDQDADFVGFEEETKKKTKKKDKGKGKKQQEVVEEIEEEDLTATERAQKVKEAMKDYKALDHEDMVSPFYHPSYVLRY